MMNLKTTLLLGLLACGTLLSAQPKKEVTRLKAMAASQVAGLKPRVRVEHYEIGQGKVMVLPKLPAGQVPNRVTYHDSLWMADFDKTWPAYDAKQGFYLLVDGVMRVDEARTYALMWKCQGMARVYVDGVLLVDEGMATSWFRREVEVYLEKGYHQMRVEYLRTMPSTSYKELRAYWYDSGKQDFVTIPASHWYHLPAEDRTAPGEKSMEVEGDAYVPGHFQSPLEGLHPSYAKTVLHRANWQPKVGGMDFLPDGRLVVSTWDSLGAVYVLDGVATGDSSSIGIKRIAWGLAEPLGLKVVDGDIYVLQKQELTRLVDNDKDGMIDEYRTVCNAWPVSGNFHEFAFGLEYRDGYFYAALAVAIQPGGRSTIPQIGSRGKIIKIGKDDGSLEYVAEGLRTPNTVGWGVDDELFVCDNQGDWIPACKLLHVSKGAFFNNYAVRLGDIGKLEAKRPVAWFPQTELGNSNSQPILCKDGPYAGQMLVGDVHYGGLQRVFVEKVNGEYQGCAFKFTQGLSGGTNRMRYGPDGALYIGMIGAPGNWGQYGKVWYGLEKIKYTGAPTFEILAVRAKANGFEIEFTQPLAKSVKLDDSLVAVSTWTYTPTMQYGGPKVDQQDLKPTSVNLYPDGKTLFVELEGLKEGYLVYLSPSYWRIASASGQKLWTSEAYYTLNSIPSELGQVAPKPAAAAPPKGSKPAAKTTAAAAPKPAPRPVAKELPEAEQLAQGKALLAKRQCRTCHADDSKVLGPALKDVAFQYRKDPKALDKLIYKVQNGGSGVWGEQAMPPQYASSKQEITYMVKYILQMR